MIQNIGIVMNNRSYAEKICYNISMIYLTKKQKIKEFKIEITKTIINITKNHIQYHMEELCDCEESNRTVRLLTNIQAFLETLG